MIRTVGAVWAIAFWSVSAGAQVKPVAPVSVPVPAISTRLIAAADIAGAAGTGVTTQGSFLGVSCEGGCIVAKSAAGERAAIRLNASGEQHATEFRTGLLVAHDVKHSVTLSLGGKEILGLLCDGHGALGILPHFGALGAANTGFSWQMFEGGKIVKSGHSAGVVIDFGMTAHSTAPMEIAVSNRGKFEISHGTSKIVVTPDDKNVATAAGLENLEISASGPASFALVRPSLRFGVQPPGI